MKSNGNFLYVVFLAIFSFISSQKVEQISVQSGQTFSFDCKDNELVYFGPQLNEWSEVKDGDNYLNLKFNLLTRDNILRITSDSAESTHTGFYACRKPVWTTTAMSRIYQVTVADVDAFYWTYVCHGAAGSCVRSGDDSSDSSSSSLEVADGTNTDLFCCATVIGYKNVKITMNQVGNLRENVYTKQKQDVDGSLVICANQHTFLSRASTRNSRTLTCELVIDEQVYSTISTNIIMKNAMPTDPELDPPYGYTPPSRDDSNDNQRKPNSRAKSRIGKKLAIIIGSLVGGILLLALIFILIFVIFCRNKASKSSTQTTKSNYIAVRKHETTKSDNDHEYAYIDPVPLYQNTPIITRH